MIFRSDLHGRNSCVIKTDLILFSLSSQKASLINLRFQKTTISNVYIYGCYVWREAKSLLCPPTLQILCPRENCTPVLDTRFHSVSNLVLFSLSRLFVKTHTKEMVLKRENLSSPFSAAITLSYTEITVSSLIQMGQTTRRLRLAFNPCYCSMSSLWPCLCF